MKKFCASISEKILNVDIFGQKPQFNIEKNDSFKTNFGSFLTFASLATTILALSYFSLQLFNVSNPKLVFSVKNIFNPPLMFLGSSNYGFSFGLQDPFTYDQFIDESVYRAEAFHMTGKRVVSGNSTFFDWTLRKLELETCALNKFPTGYHRLFKDLPFRSLYCLKNTSFSLFGTFLNEEYQYIMIKLFECKNKTIEAATPQQVLNSSNSLTNNNLQIDNNYNNDSNINFNLSKNQNDVNNENSTKENLEYKQASSEVVCKPKHYIDEILAGTFFSFSHTDLTIDPTNYTSPNQLYSGDSYTTVSNKFFKEMHHYLNVINFDTDRGWLVSDLHKQTFLKLDFIKEMTDFRKSDNFLSYTLKLSTKVETYSRSYSKVQNIAAEAGGFLKMISMVCLLASFYYNKAKFYQLVGEAIMSEKSNDKKKKQTVTCTEFDSSSQMKLDTQNPFYFEFLRKNETSFVPSSNANVNVNAKFNNFFNENANNITTPNTNSVSNKNKTPNNNDNNNNVNFNASSNDQNKENEYNKSSNNKKQLNYQRKINNKNSNKSSSPKKVINLKPAAKERNSILNCKESETKNPDIATAILKRPIAKRIKINLSFCESFRYLFCYMIQKKNKNFKKLNVIRHRVDELLDILNLFRTINDFERFKKLILDNEQLKLFNLPYYQELNLGDPLLLNQTTFSLERGKMRQEKEVNADVIFNVIADKEDAISKKMLTLVNG